MTTRTLLLCGSMMALPLWAMALPQQSLQVRYEYMEWQEFDRNGRELLKESGPRVGLQWDIEARDATWPVWSARVLAYLGDVDYDGQNQLGQPIESTTEYEGLLTEAALLLPVSLGETTELVPFAGGGAHTWIRSLDNTGGFTETGYDEWWVDLYLQGGIGLRWKLPRGEAFTRLGLRYPLYLRAEYDLTLPDGTDDASVEPGADFSWFGEAGYRGNQYVASLFAEKTNYDRSDDKNYGTVDIFQPESEQQVIGLQLGVAF